jgi:hypothetical protein
MADLTTTLRGHERIGLDTPVFISHIEGTWPLAAPAGLALDALASGAFTGVTPALTLLDSAASPRRRA